MPLKGLPDTRSPARRFRRLVHQFRLWDDGADDADGTAPRIVTTRVRCLVFALPKLIWTPRGRRFGARGRSAPAIPPRGPPPIGAAAHRLGDHRLNPVEQLFSSTRPVLLRNQLHDGACEQTGFDDDRVLFLAIGGQRLLELSPFPTEAGFRGGDPGCEVGQPGEVFQFNAGKFSKRTSDRGEQCSENTRLSRVEPRLP